MTYDSDSDKSLRHTDDAPVSRRESNQTKLHGLVTDNWSSPATMHLRIKIHMSLFGTSFENLSQSE